MIARATSHNQPPHGRTIVITRPAGTASALTRRVRALGCIPLLLPGLSLRSPVDPAAARTQWLQALRGDLLLFSSPAAVRYAIALAPLQTQAVVFAVGRETARALHRQHVDAQVPMERQDSEGLLELPALQQLHGSRVALIGAPGGRGLLREQLIARGAIWRDVYVYQRVAPRLDRRHVAGVLGLPDDARVLLSSTEALQHLMTTLPTAARQRLCATVAVVSSERLAAAARAAGFMRVRVAASARSADLLEAIG